jgi:predicted PurR-regulated permease PerM
VLLWTLFLIKGVLLVLYVSCLLAIGFSPIVNKLERDFKKWTRLRMPRWASILTLYVGLLLLVSVAAAIILPPLVAQSRALWTDLPRYIDFAQDALLRAGIMHARFTSTQLISNLPDPGSAVAGVFGALKSVAGVIATLVTVVVLPFYMLLESTGINASFIKLFARDRRPQVARLLDEVTVKLGAWLWGQLLLSGIIGTSAAIGLWLLGVPYVYVLAVLAAIGEMIPIVGPIMAAVPGILVAFAVSVHTGIFVAIYYTVQQSLENHFIVPRVMQKQVGVSAVTVIVALLIGTELLGIVGAVLAVPTAAIVQVLVSEYLERE